MSSSNDSNTVLKLANTYLYQFGGPILMLIGTVSCIINFIVFTQKTLRKNPCSIYFIAYNVANLFYIYSFLLSLTLDIGYQSDASAQNLVICRLRLYTVGLFNCLSPFYLILASIDRILVTSPNALIRRRSTLRLAYISIIGGTLFWMLFHSHALVFTEITPLGENHFFCYFQAGVYLAFMGYYSLIKEILALSLIIICGLWAVKNVRSVRRVRAAPNLFLCRTAVNGRSHSIFSKDRQLMMMVLVDTSIYGLFSFMVAIFFMYQQITQDYLKSPERIEIDKIIRNLCLFITNIPFCISCYANLIVSRTYRKEVKKILSWKRIFCIN